MYVSEGFIHLLAALGLGAFRHRHEIRLGGVISTLNVSWDLIAVLFLNHILAVRFDNDRTHVCTNWTIIIGSWSRMVELGLCAPDY